MGYITAIGASIAYVLHALGSWMTIRIARTNAGDIAMPVSVAVPRAVGMLGTAGAYLALVLLTASLAFRAAAAERPPLGNLWEFTVAFGWGVTLFSVLFERASKQQAVSAFVMPVGVALMTVAVLFFPPELKPLVPALQANRILGIHVSVMVLAYSAFCVSFGASLLYLLQAKESGKRFATLPEAETLEEVAYWSVLVAFPLLTLGVALGAWWANSAWGRYWGWDPKETSALMTWFIYASYLHARNLRGWPGHRSAALLILGFIAVLFTYFAVNFWIAGLHSYAGV